VKRLIKGKTIGIIVIGLFATSGIFGQQASQYTQYSNAQMFSNAGFAGMGRGICVNGIVRQQWAGFKDAKGNKIAPQDFLISLDSPIDFLHGGAGISILQDKLGFWSDIAVQLAYSYHKELSSGTLGIGIGINLTNRSIDFSKFKATAGGDPVLLSSKKSDMLIDANFGLFYRADNNMYLGVSTVNLLENTGKNLSSASGAIKYKTDRTFYITAGYPIELPNHPKFEIQPSILLESDFSSTQYNVSTIVNYNSKFWGGINYRLQESVGFIVGVRFKDFQIGYSYDVNTLGLGIPGSHEISLNYCFKIKADRSKTSYKNTRFL